MPATRRRAATLFAVAAVLLLLVDRATKVWAMGSLPPEGIDVIPGVLGWYLVYNTGASFGIFAGATWVFVAISAVLCVVILVYLFRYRKHPAFEAVILGVVFAGAVGNAVDRVAYGRVVDFIYLEFIDFPVFNVADICITLGVIAWVLFMIFHPLSPFAVEAEPGREGPPSKDGGSGEAGAGADFGSQGADADSGSQDVSGAGAGSGSPSRGADTNADPGSPSRGVAGADGNVAEDGGDDDAL